MSSFVYYRFPHASQDTRLLLIGGEPEELSELSQLNGRRGFVLAPFVPADDSPILLFPEERCEETHVRLPQGEKNEGQGVGQLPFQSFPRRGEDEERMAYSRCFDRFHEALCEGRFVKLVLSRSETISAAPYDPVALYEQACMLYPRMFVALVSAPRCGTWLMATPEVLLKREKMGGEAQDAGEVLRTMALAGTMKLEGELLEFDNPSQELVQQIRWSQKNIQEQRYVASYVRDCLKDFATDIEEEGPYTTRAANLVHLRSDFRFALKPGTQLGSLLEVLHPTPAVCGTPKEEAREFILGNEAHPRRYYSGFCGHLDEALYVSLRCMEIDGSRYRLYAGGGLLRDSIEQQEWEETEAKMQTMRALLS
ncbi:MAG: chorismate-binding protein [Prevotella sp.]|nr:chorismate-binding protein [Prevotella sp.]